ncbi:MAG: DUF1028 domain-containing protein [Candidatus Korarchaeota archaeon]|nr:DUF1028 domain-containing protein [Candidatus Korarchaeota archaeon]
MEEENKRLLLVLLGGAHSLDRYLFLVLPFVLGPFVSDFTTSVKTIGSWREQAFLFMAKCTAQYRKNVHIGKINEDAALNNFATFSMVARCPKTISLGACTSSASPAVRSRVPHVEAGVGAIVTQAKTNVLYGTKGLKLLKKGFSPQTALETMLRDDPDRETRQVIIIDNHGRTAAFTGKNTIDWKGNLIGKNYVVAGNMLAGSKVIEAMAQAFESSEGELAERLMKALEAGQESGGDKRGKTSAALLVMSKEQKETRPLIDLRVDEHPDPVNELRRIFENFKKGNVCQQ